MSLHVASRRIPTLLAFISILGGCSGADPGDGAPLAETEEAIKGGYSDAKDFDVVGIFDVSVGAQCSGSLIAPNVVLTARHCVAPVLNEVMGGVSCPTTSFGANHAPSSFYVTTHAIMDQSQSSYHSVQKVVTPPQDKHLCGFDEAILILSKPIDPSEATPLTPRVDTPLMTGEKYSAIGYGGTDNNGTGAGQRRRRDNLTVGCVGSKCPSQYVKVTEFEGDTGICEGDSGGPAVDTLMRVVGVTSRGGANCTTPVYGYVYGWAQWIMDTTVEASMLASVPPPPWATGYPTDPAYSEPVGDACMQPSDCSSGRCVNDSSGGYCTRLCSDKAPCPDGYQCDTTDFPDPVCTKIPPPPPDPTPAPTPAPSPKAGTSGDTGSCAVRSPGADPTKPTPWITALGAIAALALARRRRR